MKARQTCYIDNGNDSNNDRRFRTPPTRPILTSRPIYHSMSVMLHIEQTADLCLLRSDGIQLAFVFDRDRWRHEISVCQPAGWQTLLWSVEGASDEAVPPSPAFQELRLEQIAEETWEYQLFGRAGSAVYSAAIRFEAANQFVSFDVAARGQREGAALCYGSTYDSAEIASPYVITPANSDTQAQWSDPTTNPAMPHGVSRRLTYGSFGLKSADGVAAPRSVRWQYNFQRVYSGFVE